MTTKGKKPAAKKPGAKKVAAKPGTKKKASKAPIAPKVAAKETKQAELTVKQKCFGDEYLIDLNGTQAAIRAGYSEKTAQEQASRLLSNVMVQQYIAERMKARQVRTEITQDRVLQELARIAFFDIRRLYNEDGSLKRPDQLDDEAAAVLSSVDVVEMQGGAELGGPDGVVHIPMFTKKAKIFDKGTALTLAMRHLGMLKDKVEHTGKDGGAIALTMEQIASNPRSRLTVK